MRTAIAIAHVLPIASLLALATREPSGADLRRLGLSLYLAKLFGSNDVEAVVRLITALLVLVLDPLAVLLTLAATRLDSRDQARRLSPDGTP